MLLLKRFWEGPRPLRTQAKIYSWIVFETDRIWTVADYMCYHVMGPGRMHNSGICQTSTETSLMFSVTAENSVNDNKLRYIADAACEAHKMSMLQAVHFPDVDAKCLPLSSRRAYRALRRPSEQ